jgi:hypothetical protein
MQPKVAAISNEDLTPRFSKVELTAQAMHSLMRSEEWNAIDFRNAQIVSLVESAEPKCDIALDNWALANLF